MLTGAAFGVAGLAPGFRGNRGSFNGVGERIREWSFRLMAGPRGGRKERDPMSTIIGTTNPKTAAADEPTAITPEALVEHLRTLRLQIPEYRQLARVNARALRRASQVDPVFAHAAVNTIGASSTIEDAVGRTPADLRQDEVEITRWTAVEDELKAMLKGVSAANLVRRHRLGLAALQAYNISQQLVRHPDHADLLPHVEGMKRLNKFGRRRAKAPVEPPPVEPPVVPQRK